MNGKEIIFWNSKSTIMENRKKGIAWLKSTGISEFCKYPFPPCVKLQLFIWEPRKEPQIITVKRAVE